MNRTEKFNPFEKCLDIRHLLSTPPPPLDYVLPGLLAGTVGMLAGPGGVGKTMFELQLALAVACGGRICGGLFESGELNISLSQKPAKVALVAAEESVEVFWHRLHAVAATLINNPQLLGVDASPAELLDLWDKNLHIVPLAGMGPVTLLDSNLEEVQDSVESMLSLCTGARLVMLDPIRQFHNCDENDSRAMSKLVQILQVVAYKSRAAVVFAHHTNRASTQLGLGDTSGAARGSTALTDGVRWQLNLSQPTVELARQQRISASDRKGFVAVDIAKTNYMPQQPTTILQRLPGGVLMVLDDTQGQGAECQGRASRPRAKSQRK